MSDTDVSESLGTVRHAELHSGKGNRTGMNHRGIREQLNGRRVPLLRIAGREDKSLNSCSGLDGTGIVGTNWLIGLSSGNTSDNFVRQEERESG